MRKKVVVVAGVAALLAVWVVPPLRARAKAVAVLADAAGLPFPRAFAPSVHVDRVEIGVIGDLYSPGIDAPAILLVPGAARRGTEDPRVVRTATALAEAGRRVFVPELHLYDRTFREDDIDRIARAAVALAGAGTIGVVGFSYGGSLTLLAAQDREVQEHLDFVAVFGAYYDLVHLVQGVTTGATVLDGKEETFDTVPDARSLLVDAIARVSPEASEEDLRTAMQTGDANDLPPEARPLFELITNEDPRRVKGLVDDLPAHYREFLTRFSPSGRIGGIDVPVFILQARNDEATPWTEAIYLERHIEGARVLFLEHFSHVDPPGLGGILLDAPDAWRFVSWILAAQE